MRLGRQWMKVAFAAAVAVSTAFAAPEEDPAAAFARQDWEAAATGYARVAAEEPENAQAWFRLGYAHHALGDYESALQAHEKAAAMPFPGRVTAAYNAACASSRLGRLDGALEWLRQAASLGFKSGGLLDTDPDLESLRSEDGYWQVRNGILAKTRYRSLAAAEPGTARDFDFWVGDWEAQIRRADGAGGWTPGGRVLSRVVRAAGGNAIVEYSESPAGAGSMLGFSVRTYDPRAREWIAVLNWPSPEKPLFYALSGWTHHGRAETVTSLSGVPGAPATKQTRFAFSDVSHDRYRWDSASTQDGGVTWKTTLVFEARRREAGEEPLTIGPSRSTSRAGGDVFRGLDFLEGTWTGTRTVAGSSAPPVAIRMHTTSIMEGAAQVSETWVGEGETASESFSVRAYEPGRRAWVQYDVDDRRPGFRRYEGVIDDTGAVTLAGSPGPGSAGASGTLRIASPANGVAHVEHVRDGVVEWVDELRRE